MPVVTADRFGGSGQTEVPGRVWAARRSRQRRKRLETYRLDLRPDLEPVEADEPTAEESLPEVRLSKTRIKKMRQEVQRRLATKREARRTVVPQPPPRYDAVFAEGVAWLDGPTPEPQRGKLSFSDDVWTSRARGDTELP